MNLTADGNLYIFFLSLVRMPPAAVGGGRERQKSFSDVASSWARWSWTKD